MEKQNRFAVGANFRFAVAKHARALRLERITGNANVGYFVADVLDTAVGILLQELGDWRILPSRL